MGVTNFYAGSLKYGPSGKKRKTNSMSRPKKKSMKDYNWSTPVQNSSYIREHINYPSAEMIPPVKETDNSWKKEESKKFTVAPAYNKGAYQVIPRGDVEYIGK